MPGIHEIKRLPYSAEQMIDLVADVARYGEFLPWVVATRVRSDSGTEMIADMLIGFDKFREKFTSLVHKRKPHEIIVEYVEGPMRKLENSWRFTSTERGGCRIVVTANFVVCVAIVGLQIDLAAAEPRMLPALNAFDLHS